MSRIHCPYCGATDLFWPSSDEDIIVWTDDDAGTITSRGVCCKDKNCKGYLGFDVCMGFITDNDCAEYTDDKGNVIEEDYDE